MEKNKATKIDIPVNEIERIDDMFFSQIQMRGDKVMKKFAAQYEETKEQIFSNVSVEGIFTSYKIDKIEDNDIWLENNTKISSEMLAGLFKECEEIIVCAMTVHGYDPLEEAAKGKNIETLFLDGWGTAVAECGHVWMKEQIVKELEEGKYATSSWSPGQHNVDIKIQKDLFALLHPEEIGITLTDSFMMHPKKSISSFIGVSRNDKVVQLRACDVCRLRDKCPSAYV